MTFAVGAGGSIEKRYFEFPLCRRRLGHSLMISRGGWRNNPTLIY